MAQMRGVDLGDSSDYKTEGKKKFLYFVAVIAALGGMLFGYDTGVIASALIFINKTFHPTVWQQEMVVSMVVAGAFFGAIFSGKLSNKFGRRKVLIWTAITFIIGTVICTFAPEIWTLIFGRLILGIAVGVASYTAPLFIAEISLPDKRGLMVVLNCIFITGAQAAAFLIGFYLQKHLPEYLSWRYMVGAAVIPSILLLIGMVFAPSSPRWLLMKGKVKAAREVLRKIRDFDKVEQEIDDIKSSLGFQHGGWKELFSKTVRPVLIIGLALGILQQFAGINTVMYYGPEIFKQVGFHGASAQILATFGMGCLNFLMTVIAMFTVDKFGRKSIMIFGTSVAMISLAVLGYVMHVGVEHVAGGKAIAVVCLIVYMVGYAYSLGTIFWLMISEIFPLKIRSIGMGFVAGIQWGANFLVTATFLTVLTTFGSDYTFWFYAVMCFVALLFSIFYLPETKGVSLETIEINLENGVKARHLGRVISKNRPNKI
ncbi:MAG TPA: sugar porter family MFS transporter [Victivallales bacterium]|nr:sugar porter family MFS transporter [Victivallales bacterium]